NTATESRTITWKEDHTAPIITSSGTTLALGCNPSSTDIHAAVVPVTASDHCDGVVTVDAQDGLVSGDCIKSQTRTFTTTDACGKTATDSRTITWTEDHTAPLIASSGTTLALGCNPSSTEINSALGSAT